MEILRKYYKLLIGSALGGAAGFAYYYYIGCNSGNCPITSNWHISTLYGVLMGFIAFFPTKKKKEQEK